MDGQLLSEKLGPQTMKEEVGTIQKEKALLSKIREGERKVLHQQYQLHRTAFVEWAERRYRCRTEDLMDIYQEAFIVLYQNLVEGKIDDMKCSIRTYIFSVAKNLLFKQFRTNSRVESTDTEAMYYLADEDLNVEEEWVATEKQLNLKQAIAQLGKVCQELLTLFYYHGLDQESIMQRMEYKNRQTVKSQKVRCMRQLEKLAKSSFEGELR
ncbi:MAG: sigma-70 family RNA polymerase sigma factor [Saprospiraceae bacterium]|nr:sigma-70 family RNA polymerase sigma factor [Saprospiraceae bacterium]